MAIEPKRGCGYRKVGGLYLVGSGEGRVCDRLPLQLDICPCCGQWIKFTRGWTWVDVDKLVQGPHVIGTHKLAPAYREICQEASKCPLCGHPETIGRAGLLWIGGKFYPFPAHFLAEGATLGFSRRIKSVPHGFKLGETWVLLAHLKAVRTFDDKPLDNKNGAPFADMEQIVTFKPGIFYLWRPQRIEKLLFESQRGSEEVEKLEKRGITPVFVPDSDPDHQGNVFDDFENQKELEL